MKVRNIIVSIAAASVLFTACGGGGSTVINTGDDKGGPGKITSKPVAKLKTTTFNVLSNQSKSVSIPLNQVIVNTADSHSFYKYEILESTGGTAKLDRGNFGFLEYKNDGTSATGSVKVAVSRDGFTSDPIVLTFNVVDAATATTVKVMKTGQSTGDAGEERTFVKDVTTTEDNVKDALGLEWLDNRNATTDLALFTEAKNICAGQGFRLPTEDELYNIIDYGKDYKDNMVDTKFSKILSSSWADKIDDKKISIANTLGKRNDPVDKAQFRCVKGSAQPTDHLIFSDRVLGDTYDISTHLEWSPVEKSDAGQKTYADAVTYCDAKNGVYGGKQTGWRVPTINELRSFIQDNAIAPIIHGGSYTLLSSTSAIDSGVTYNYGLNTNWFKNEKPEITLFLQQEATINSKSYQPQTAGITCVRPFTDGQIPQ